MMYDQIAAQQIRANTIGMWVLLIWALVNIAVGAYFSLTHKHRDRKFYFFQFNMYWNFVNLIIAGATLYCLGMLTPANFSVKQTIYMGFNFEKIILFNTALDIAYIVFGSFLVERGMRVKKVLLEGYGTSLWLQGGFLFVLDIVIFLVNAYYNQQYNFFILF